MDLRVLSLTEKAGLEIHISGFFRVSLTFRAMRLEITKEAGITREGGKVWAPSSGL